MATEVSLHSEPAFVAEESEVEKARQGIRGARDRPNSSLLLSYVALSSTRMKNAPTTYIFMFYDDEDLDPLLDAVLHLGE